MCGGNESSLKQMGWRNKKESSVLGWTPGRWRVVQQTCSPGETQNCASILLGTEEA